MVGNPETSGIPGILVVLSGLPVTQELWGTTYRDSLPSGARRLTSERANVGFERYIANGE
jgi:hypothetical protein